MQVYIKIDKIDKILNTYLYIAKQSSFKLMSNFIYEQIKFILIWINKNKLGIGDWGLGIGDWGLGDRKSVV